jgi:hypothetical protein
MLPDQVGGVFISYSHEDPVHQHRVAELVARLRADEIEVIIDCDKYPGGPSEGWPLWCQRQVKNASKVLMICTETYKRRYEAEEEPGVGHGVIFEAAAIRQAIINQGGENERFRCVCFQDEHVVHIPDQLKPYQHFVPVEPGAYADLLKWLRESNPPPPPPGAPPSERGGPRKPKPRSPRPVGPPRPRGGFVRQLANREHEFRLFEHMITGVMKQRVLLLRGGNNRGKTALLIEFFKMVRYYELPGSMVNLKGCLTLDDLFDYLTLDLSASILPETHAELKRIRALPVDLRALRTPLVLGFDAYQEATPAIMSWLDNNLLRFVDDCPNLLVVIAGHLVPDERGKIWESATAVYNLPEIRDPADWLHFAKGKWDCPDLDLDVVQTLVRATDGDPGTMRTNLETFVRNYVNR